MKHGKDFTVSQIRWNPHRYPRRRGQYREYLRTKKEGDDRSNDCL